MLATVTATELSPLLDEAQAGLLSAAPERIREFLDLLTGELAERRATQAAPEWRATMAECRRHPLAQLLLDDPLTRRALTRPRGVAGDAELLDMIYRRSWRGLAPEPTRVGAAVFAHTTGGRTAVALRARREFIAQEIAQTCESVRYPHVLAVGCGHLRELGLCEPFLAGKVGRFVGLDDDEAALREVQRSLPSLLVQTVRGSTALLLSGGLPDQQFDLIYSAGLYDSLANDTAGRLTRRLFQLLRPGGRLLVANFARGVADTGFVEAFMDWHLHYREVRELAELAFGAGVGLARPPRIFPDASGATLYLELVREA